MNNALYSIQVFNNKCSTINARFVFPIKIHYAIYISLFQVIRKKGQFCMLDNIAGSAIYFIRQDGLMMHSQVAAFFSMLLRKLY